MQIAHRLQQILIASGLTQEELAERLGVSFQTLNSWINKRSEPRAKMVARIIEASIEYLGSDNFEKSSLAAKKIKFMELKESTPYPLGLINRRKDIYDELMLAMTYHTNSLEGSTLKQSQVQAVLFEGMVFADKTLVEHQEVKNHQSAWSYLLRWVAEGNLKITEDLILELHQILMTGIWDNAGRYRKHPVRILGSRVVTANYVKVPILMNQFIEELNKYRSQDIVKHMAITHAKFEQIHPFADGNGRVGRLLLNALALQNNLFPVLVKRPHRRAYLKYLQTAQTKQSYSQLEEFIYDALIEGYELIAINTH